MKHRLFNILSALSVLVFVALGVLCMRSIWVRDAIVGSFPYPSGRGSFEPMVGSSHGSIQLIWAGKTYSHEPGSRYVEYQARSIALLLVERWGFGFWWDGWWSRQTRFFWAVSMPHWLPMLAAAIRPIAWLTKARKQQHRLKQGMCLACGYDLRASKDRCPECGTPIVATESTAGLEKGATRHKKCAVAPFLDYKKCAVAPFLDIKNVQWPLFWIDKREGLIRPHPKIDQPLRLI